MERLRLVLTVEIDGAPFCEKEKEGDEEHHYDLEMIRKVYQRKGIFFNEPLKVVHAYEVIEEC